MQLDKKEKDYLDGLCHKFRIDLIEMLYNAQTGHPGGSLSAVEIIVTLYFKTLNNVNSRNPATPNRDRFVLSKGHAAPILYLALAEKGFFPKEDLSTFRQLGSHLQGHPSQLKTPGIDLSSGPLGLGLSAGLGMALSAKISGLDYYTYVLMGDGEIQEGVIWEAAMSAAKFKADNLIAFIDHNGVQLDGTTNEIMPLGNLAAKWESFGWHTIKTDGHDIPSLVRAIEEAKQTKDSPTVILAKTAKGKGVSFMEGKNIWHGKPINDIEFTEAMIELRGDNNE